MASIQNYLFQRFLHLGIKIAQHKIKGRENVTVEETRKGLERLFSVSKIPKGVKFQKVQIDGLHAEWIVPKNLKNNGVVLYLHGGGYMLGSISTHSPLMARIALASKTKVLAIEYGLAPERPYPAALEDSIKAYHWLIAQGYDPKKIVISGDSSGGGLAVATVLKLRDDNGPQPAACACLSPWLDLHVSGKTVLTHAKKDLLVNSIGLKLAAGYYAKEIEFAHPYISPIYSDPTGLPPMYFQVSGSEILLDDTLRFEKKAKECGVDIEVHVWHNMLHVWQAFGFLPEAAKAIKDIGMYIENKVK
jgi:epsilon-lactone hydrolase